MHEEDGQGYRAEILRQRAVWLTKPVIRTLYRRWYQGVVEHLGPHGPTVEIGAGCGNFKEYLPSIIATDFYASGPWIDQVMDAQNLNLPPASVGNLVAFDVIHHLQRPLDFLRRSCAALRPAGRLVLCEPAFTPWSRLVYSRHHEVMDPSWDLFGLEGTPPLSDPHHTFANMAIAHLLFRRHLDRTHSLIPPLRLIQIRSSDFLLYPLSGGFSYRSWIPEFGLSTALRLEAALTWPFASWLTGLRQLIVLEKQPIV